MASASLNEAFAVAIQQDGKIVAAGVSDAGTTGDFALVRYDTIGSLDTTFGAGGKVLSGFGSAGDDEASALAIQQDGKIVAAGDSTANGSEDFAITRYQGAPPVPQIASFSPRSGPVGTSVTIAGVNFAGTTAVWFNNTSQPTFAVDATGT